MGLGEGVDRDGREENGKRDRSGRERERERERLVERQGWEREREEREGVTGEKEKKL